MVCDVLSSPGIVIIGNSCRTGFKRQRGHRCREISVTRCVVNSNSIFSIRCPYTVGSIYGMISTHYKNELRNYGILLRSSTVRQLHD